MWSDPSREVLDVKQYDRHIEIVQDKESRSQIRLLEFYA